MPGMPAGFASGPPPGGSISPSQLASQAAYTVLGNPTASPASPIATTDPVVSGSATAARFLASANNTAAAPSVLIEPGGNSGLYWDATKGVVTSVDAVERMVARVNGTVELSTGAGISAGVPALRLVRDTADIQVFLTGSSPEAAITGQIGDLDVAVTGGFLYIKRTGVGNTGWALIDRCESGTYTPTFNSVTNLDSTPTVVGTWRYIRVGDVVYVGGAVSVDPTASGAIAFRATVPIASAFSSQAHASGQANTSSLSGFVEADATNDDLAVSVGANTATAAYTLRVSCSYVVL